VKPRPESRAFSASSEALHLFNDSPGADADGAGGLEETEEGNPRLWYATPSVYREQKGFSLPPGEDVVGAR
jgi:hypothetical protein